MSSAIDTVVFLGPTLSLETAQEIFPEACYHTPVQYGDVFRILRLRPKKIVLIDGLFESVRSVWHKEILFALEKGTMVYGASSMGALRASELAPFGVIGVGKIFRDFSTSVLDNDDAVAVLHVDQNKNFAPINEALTDLQATLEAAHTAEAISTEQKTALFSTMSSWFYPERTLRRLAAKAKDDPALFQSFYDWIQKNGLVYQKKIDAIEALHRARAGQEIGSDPLEVPKTLFFRRQMRAINLSAFKQPYAWLPSEERELVFLEQNRPKFFKVLKQAAYALSIGSDLAYFETLQSEPWMLSQVAKRPKMVQPYFSSFVEIFGCEDPVYLFTLFFLAIDEFLDRFLSPCNYKSFSELERSAKSHCDVEKVHRISKKYAIEPRRIFRFYSAFQGENLSCIKAALFDSINWLTLAKEKVATLRREAPFPFKIGS